jgi:hypothetical protein
MGFPDLQDGRPPADGAAAGPRPLGRSGAHRRSATSPQKQPWPAAPAVTGPQDRPPAPGRTGTGPQDGSPGLAITREAPGTRRAVPQPGAHRSGARGGPLRGFPPAPGQPDPVYPPGQFSPWNRASTRSAWLGIARTGGAGADADPGYSALAVSDAAADLTSTQTLAVIDDEPPAGPSLPVRAGRDWGSHTGEPPWQRAAGGSAPGGPGSQATASRAPARGTGLPGAGAKEPATGPQGPAGANTGPQGLAAPGAPERGAPGGRMAARQAAVPGAGAVTGRPAPSAFGEAERGRRSRAAASGTLAAEGEGEPEGRRAGRRGGRSNAMMAGLLLAPVLVVLVVVAGYVYLSGKHSPAPARPAVSSHPAASPSSPGPTLGPWKHIESRSQDPVPLTVSQLFPARFARDGASGTLAVTKSGTRCSRAVFGSKLAAAIRKAKCTQVLRASYLSTDRKIMATVGVLNLKDVTGAEKAGRAAGATEFIKQLPSRRGPTRNIAKGTGIEVAEVKGHYLILIWTEFANLHKPSSKSQRQKLESFSMGLVAGTANISLSNRMVTGHP